MNIKYCLDTNVLIEAWSKYYAPSITPSYWDTLNNLGSNGVIFIPVEVADEIHKTQDALSAWLKGSSIPTYRTDGQVTQCLNAIYRKDPSHKRLVDSIQQRSLADPWVIAHAMRNNAVVVTKENMELVTSKRIKIPNVCANMGIRSINDFEFIAELGITFKCEIK